ncbi:MAG: hypothetical protein H7281_17085 [Bacteriovorax sp.]|nr:hypothetical protein [Bacteriovorax sp.]
MKKFIVALMVLTSLVSCGKNNSVSSNGLSTSPLTVSGAVESQLGSIIDNSQFGTGAATYYETWNQYVAHMPNVNYVYGTVTPQAANSNCTTSGGFIKFTWCSSSSSSSTSTNAVVTRRVVHSAVDLLTKRNELKAIINRRASLNQDAYTAGVYHIITTDNQYYVIDTRYPLQANPVYIQTTSTTAEKLIAIQ